MESWRRQFYHSAKGTTWSEHKYIRKEGNRYIYKDEATAKRDIEKLNAEKKDIAVDRNQFMSPRKLAYLEALFRQKFNVELLGQDPNRIVVASPSDDSGRSPKDYIDYYESEVDKYFDEIGIRDIKIAEIEKEMDRHKLWAGK